MNSGFRNLLGGRDTSRFQAYLIAVALQILILSPLSAFGIVKLDVPSFYPLGAVVGGLLFGLAMNWGGGCAGGLLYKIGSGSISAVVAAILGIPGNPVNPRAARLIVSRSWRRLLLHQAGFR